MKKIFTKLFLLTTLLMLSSELWAQDPLVMCLRSDKQTIKRTVSRKDLIYNLPGPGSTLYVYLGSTGTFTYSISGYSEHDCGGDVTTIQALRTTTEVSKSYDIEGKGYKSIKLTIYPGAKNVELYDLEILARYANIPNPYTFDDAGYNSANSSTSFTMDYYGEPPTINYEYVTGDGYSGYEKFPISFAYSNGKITMNVQYRHNEVGTHKAEIKLNYSTTSAYSRFTVYGTTTKANQTIAWTPPTEMTVGDSHTLSATAPGGAVSYEVTGNAVTRSGNTLTAVKAGTVTITASQAGNGNYNPAPSVTKEITIKKATPTVSAWPTIAPVTYGTNLGAALVLKGGSASVAGTFVITDAYTAATVPNAGTHTYNLEFRPTESNKYNNVSGGTATLTVNKADQVIAWTATPPTEMTVGDSHTLSATALGGAIAFAISGDAATLAENTLTAVQAGTVTITASQAGNGNYNAAANVTHTITINKATPTVTAWPTIAAVTYGASLEQALVLVGGEASVAGTFAITDSYNAADVPNAGTHTYSVEFRPTESNKYNIVSGGTATLTVNQATPSVTWPTFAEVTYGTTLKDALQLVGGNANVEGAFHISGEYNEEEVPVVGTYKYAVWFNPTDYTNYTSLYKDDVTLTVNKANQTITWDFADCTLLPGQTLELNATATCGAMTYLVSGAAISVSGTTLTAVAEGTASIKATHAGNENYNAIESPEYTITVSASGYTRTVTNGDYGTICLPYGSSNYSGADFYEIAYAEIKNGDATGLYLDQIEEGAALVAGKPYIFKATADILIVTYEGAIVDAPIAGDAGLTGTLVDIPANDVLVGNYIIAQNMFWDASAENYLNANHAYINKIILLQTEPKSLVPGRRRVSMGETSGNVATDVENSQLPMINSQKLIENGLLIIIRDGVKYNAHGQKL